MGIEFKLGRQDHKKVEDFLGRRPAGVDAITIDVTHVSYRGGAADEAKAMGIDVLVDPMTERLADIGVPVPARGLRRSPILISSGSSRTRVDVGP